jgi:8-oxo-dGTP diphosphatase
MERNQVVCALLFNFGKVALFQRLDSDQGVGGKWEFPGGKLEQAESLEEALIREIREELDIQLLSFTYAGKMDWDYPHISLCLHCFYSDSWLGEIELRTHQQFHWMDFSNLERYDLADADRALLPMLTRSNLPFI